MLTGDLVTAVIRPGGAQPAGADGWLVANGQE